MLRKSRRILLTALSLLMAFSLMACTAGDPPTEPIIDNPVVTPAPSDEPATPAEPVEPEPTEPEPVVSADLQPIVFEDVGDLSGVTSLEMARLMGHGINLGNTMEACDSSERIPNREPSVYEQMWGAPITTPEMIAGMAAAGFRTLRVPVAWTNAMDFENGDLTIDPAYLDRV
ncbi:MAG: glycoside hydrolase family 5 protein, partial [Oscillospiraceae bacterium]|nr:glycoside hydrolase family 5 protein [Oscillospiraceae bacterium]